MNSPLKPRAQQNKYKYKSVFNLPIIKRDKLGQTQWRPTV